MQGAERVPATGSIPTAPSHLHRLSGDAAGHRQLSPPKPSYFGVAQAGGGWQPQLGWGELNDGQADLEGSAIQPRSSSGAAGRPSQLQADAGAGGF